MSYVSRVKSGNLMNSTTYKYSCTNAPPSKIEPGEVRVHPEVCVREHGGHVIAI